ncbi:hypothetical protein QOZ80_7BG0599130 [Eleusine coracana subsp. coracana]|nr:hypothetical protein QOZ80_7BG0599030 [Eleusine coracana subsp. coracana]KAK3125033.1 hypothetical protein QOZ80_7BG0599130 [Eleusine coracana subsp. coracana]
MAISDEDDSFFCPSNDRLVDRYLRAKLDGRLSDLGAKAAYFVDADVCSARPEDLVRRHGMPASVKSRDAADCKQWYFFSPVRLLGCSTKKKSRTIAGTDDKESWHAEGSPKPIDGSTCSGYVTKFSYHIRIGPKITEKPGWIMAEYSFKDEDVVLCKIYKSPRGPGRSSKRKAAEDIEAPSTRLRMTHEDQNEDDAMFAGDLEHSLLSAVSESQQMQNIEESQQELQFGGQMQNIGTMAFDELEKMMMTDVEDQAGTTLQVPEGEDPEAFYWGVLFGDEEHASIQTVQGPLTDGDVIAALASGVTLDELLLDGPSSPHPFAALGVPCA